MQGASAYASMAVTQRFWPSAGSCYLPPALKPALQHVATRDRRACVKAHKLALLAQRAFWRSLLHDSLNLTDMLASFKNMEAAEQTAVYVYKRVLERYPQVCAGLGFAPLCQPLRQRWQRSKPVLRLYASSCNVCGVLLLLQNGKLLKVYGRFQEWVLHDPHRAARSYAEAIKRGLGDNMLNLTREGSRL